MNRVFLIGRLTKDPELKQTNGNIPVTTFSVATDEGKDANGEKIAEFHNCVAWRQKAEFVARYFHKGDGISVVGKLKTRSWEKDGQKHRATEVMVSEVEFLPGRKSEEPQTPPKFSPVDVDVDLPWEI